MGQDLSAFRVVFGNAPAAVSLMMLADFYLARANPPDDDNVRYERKLQTAVFKMSWRKLGDVGEPFGRRASARAPYY